MGEAKRRGFLVGRIIREKVDERARGLVIVFADGRDSRLLLEPLDSRQVGDRVVGHAVEGEDIEKPIHGRRLQYLKRVHP